MASVKSLVQKLNELLTNAESTLQKLHSAVIRPWLYSKTSVLMNNLADNLPSGYLAKKAADLVQKTCLAIKVHLTLAAGWENCTPTPQMAT